MKTKYEDCGTKPLEYPVLGLFENTGRIVLFFGPTTGVELYPQIRQQTSSWASGWVVCRGFITLANDATYDMMSIKGEKDEVL